MKKFLAVAIGLIVMIGCSPKREVVEVINGKDGKDGTSCSVSDFISEEVKLGVLISCTDGSVAVLLNGENGVGIAGPTGLTGPQGAAGATGEAGNDGESCLLSRGHSHNYVLIQCGEEEVVVRDGKDGKDGQDGQDGQDNEDDEDDGLGCTLVKVDSNKNHYQLTCGDVTATFANVGGK